MSSVMLSVLLVVANVLGAGMLVPQALRMVRTGRVDGVSGAWLGVGVAMNVWWVTYALPHGLWGLLPVSLVCGVLYASMAARYLRVLGGGVRPMLAGATLFGLPPLVSLGIGGWEAAALVIGLSYGAQFAPAAVAAVRAPSVAGISSLTWSMAGIEALIWLVYGLSIGDAALIVGGAGSGLMAAVILARVAVGSRTTLRTGGAPALSRA